jgi:hypothetical protein
MAAGPVSQYITGMAKSTAHILFFGEIGIMRHPAPNTKTTATVRVKEIWGNMANRHSIMGKTKERVNLYALFSVGKDSLSHRFDSCWTTRKITV